MIIVNNVFIQQNAFINASEPKKEEKKKDVFVTRALEETLKLSEKDLRNLWNTFIDESAMYGEDSYVYDFQDKNDICDLISGMTQKEYEYFLKVINGKRYFQSIWTLGDRNTINIVDIKQMIARYWGDIITSVMNYPTCYEVLRSFDEDTDKCFYFGEVICPLLCEKVGVEFLRK